MLILKMKIIEEDLLAKFGIKAEVTQVETLCVIKVYNIKAANKIFDYYQNLYPCSLHSNKEMDSIDYKINHYMIVFNIHSAYVNA